MELENTWTCGRCNATNTGDVFTGACWSCGYSWADKPLRVETAEELGVGPDCRATDGYHKMTCPTHPLPRKKIKP